MTDSALISSPVRFSTTTLDDKAEAFRQAARHTARVRFLRIGVLAAAVVLALAIAAFALFDPLRSMLPSGVSIEGAGLSGSKVTMQHPTMSGFRNNGLPYDFKADTAVQDLKSPTVLLLNQLDAHVGMSDGVAHIQADQGIYDTAKEMMDLKGNIHITSSSGANIQMRSAHIEFNGGNVSSREPVNVAMTTGTVVADTMHMTGNGADLTFEGHVHSTMTPGSTSAIGLRP